jgi:hypothetical protein
VCSAHLKQDHGAQPAVAQAGEIRTDWAKKDREEGQRFIDAFIETINADHQDVIAVNRDIGCLMRNEIERLRKSQAALDRARKCAEVAQEALQEITTLYPSAAAALAEIALARMDEILEVND